MAEAFAFYFISACILGFAVLVISTKDTVHSVLFLVADFLFVAALYVLLGAQFLAAIQILVYAGGIVVLYLFVVMLVNLKRPPEAHSDPHRKTNWGFALSIAVLVELGIVAAYSYARPAPVLAAAAAPLLHQIAGAIERLPADRASNRAAYTRRAVRFGKASAVAVLAGAFLLRHLVLRAGNESAKRPRDYFRFSQPR